MKKIALFVLSFVVVSSKSQNLIQNGGFDTLTTCPTAQGQLNYASPWLSARGTCDLFNACGSGQFGVPSNQAGFQSAQNGSGYAGFFATQGYWEVREYLYAPLRDSLRAGKQYCLSFYVCLGDGVDNLGDTMCDVSVNDIGAYFTNTPQTPQPSNFNHYPYTPQVKNPHANILKDRQNWMQVSGSFTATGGEKYIIIGSFSDMATQDTTWLDTWNFNNWAYYLIDNVTLVDCSAGNPLSVTVAGTNQICQGQSTTLTATATGGTPNYTYSWSNALPNGATQIVSPSSTTVYTVNVTDNVGNVTTQQYTVTVTPAPVANAGQDTTICAGSSVTLTATGGTNYSWSTGSNTASTIVSPGTTGNYVVTVFNGSCSDKDTVKVIVTASPIANAGSDVTICIGQSTLLTATGGGTYLWNTGASTASIIVSPMSTGNYVVTVSNGACSSKDTVKVTVVSIPVANAGPDVTICTGYSATLTATGGGAYQWNTGAASSNITVSPITTTDYIVNVSNGTCSNKDTVQVSVVSPPNANAGFDVAICKGSSTVLNASGGGTYQWSNGASTASTTVSPIATAYYIVTVSNGVCTDKDTVKVTANPLPAANAGPDTTICSNEAITLHATGGGTYLWSTGSTANSTQVSPASTTNYYVTVTNGACNATDTVLVEVNPLGIGKCELPPSSIVTPNIFTPNGDGINDLFQIEVININSLECTIYNRWGEAIYIMHGSNAGWSGTTSKGEQAAAGTYYFILNASGADQKQYNLKGFVELIR